MEVDVEEDGALAPDTGQGFDLGGEEGEEDEVDEVDEEEQAEEEEVYEYSEQQVREIRKAFKVYDELSSDAIPVVHLGPALRSLALNPTEAQLSEAVRWLDTHPTRGQVRYKEFLVILGRALKDPITVEHVVDGFCRLEEGKEGVVSRARLLDVLTTTGEKLFPLEFAAFIKYADPKKKGTVKYEDFVRKMNSGQLKTDRKKKKRRKKRKKKKVRKRLAGDGSVDAAASAHAQTGME